MRGTRSSIIVSLWFITGLASSISWRIKAGAGAGAASAVVADAPAPLAADATAAIVVPAAPGATPVHGRLQSIAGLTRALTAPAGSRAATEIDEWAKRLCVIDAFLACEMLMKSPKSEARDKALRRSILEAAKSDPFRAFAFFSKLGSAGIEDNTRRDLIRLMTKKDARLTWDTLAAAGGINKSEVEQIATDWGRAQGFAAASFGLSLRDPIQRSMFLRQALPSWIGEDIAAFAKWFSQQPDELGLERFVTFDAFASDHVHKTPTLAILDAALKLDLPLESSSMGYIFAAAWSNPNLREKAAAWIGAQKDTAVRDAAWKELALSYSETDHSRAREILPLIENQKVRQNVSSTLAAEMAKSEPLDAMQFAASLSDDARSKAQASALTTWAKHQPKESLHF